MKATQTLSKTKPSVSSAHAQKEITDIDLKISKTAIGIIALLSAFIGLWGIVCLTAGFAMTGNLFELGAGWFSAILGL